MARASVQRVAIWFVIAAAGLVLLWLVLSPRSNPGTDDPNGLRQGSIPGNRDGTPGQTVR